jgi:putative transposase
MSRYPRPVFKDIPLHIVQRGNNRNACFFGRGDYLTYLSMLAEALEEFPCVLHAYVLMPNHVHLLVSPADIRGPALLMKRVGQRYVQHVNRKYGRYGTLWQGRYHSSLVDTEPYFMACQRYIELNPVRAGLVAHPVDYEWSSYLVHAHGKASDIVVPHDLYNGMATENALRQSRYRELIAEALPQCLIDVVRQATNGNGICGSAQFSERLGVALGRDFAARTRANHAT